MEGVPAAYRAMSRKPTLSANWVVITKTNLLSGGFQTTFSDNIQTSL